MTIVVVPLLEELEFRVQKLESATSRHDFPHIQALPEVTKSVREDRLRTQNISCVFRHELVHGYLVHSCARKYWHVILGVHSVPQSGGRVSWICRLPYLERCKTFVAHSTPLAAAVHCVET